MRTQKSHLSAKGNATGGATSVMKVCGKCHAEFADDQNFCERCGLPLMAKEASATPPVAGTSPASGSLTPSLDLAQKRQTCFSIGTAVAALVCFFLSWFEVSCGGQKVATLSGWNVAAGIEMMGERQAGHLYVLLTLLLLPVVLLLLVGSFLQSRPAPSAAAIPQMLAGVFCILMPVVEYLRLRSQAKNPSNEGAVSIETQYGFWGILVSGLLLALLGFLSLPRNAPQPRSVDRAG